jgi:plasmid stabilization system protein ParE
MSRWELSPRARRDLFEIWDYIAEDNAAAAERFELAIFSAFDLLAVSPLAGQVRKKLPRYPFDFGWCNPTRIISSFTTRARNPFRLCEFFTRREILGPCFAKGRPGTRPYLSPVAKGESRCGGIQRWYSSVCIFLILYFYFARR